MAVGAALALSGLLSLWVADADTRLANAARDAAGQICRRARTESGTLWFGGHWGFQYYLQGCGAQPVDLSSVAVQAGDLVALPENNVELFQLRPETTQSLMQVRFEIPYFATTMRWELGAGFYTAVWGPLPFSFGPVPPEGYRLVHLEETRAAK